LFPLVVQFDQSLLIRYEMIRFYFASIPFYEQTALEKRASDSAAFFLQCSGIITETHGELSRVLKNRWKSKKSRNARKNFLFILCASKLRVNKKSFFLLILYILYYVFNKSATTTADNGVVVFYC
jgi:hypothetical protein